jgi:hypothetical protein
MIPGPSSTDNGLPVRKTGSPTVTPAKERFQMDLSSKIFPYMFLHRLE